MLDFPRELDEEEDDDGNVENVEETFGKFATICFVVSGVLFYTDILIKLITY